MHRFFLSFFLLIHLSAEPTLTYEMPGGRLGDHLISYLHAKWISYRYGMPIAYRSFEGSDSFMLHELEEPIDPQQKVITVSDLALLEQLDDKMYEILYAPDYIGEYDSNDPVLSSFLAKRPFIEVDWNDQKFIEWVRPFLAPRTPIQLLTLPDDKVTVALHIRKSVGLDAKLSYDHRVYPYKFLPDQFYVDQLHWIYEKMGRRPLYVYIFSNDPRPSRIASRLSKLLKIKNVIFDYPKGRDVDTLDSILSDFYSMMHFDCIIRPESNFSIIASKLGHQKFVISPGHVTSTSHANIVDRVRIERR